MEEDSRAGALSLPWRVWPFIFYRVGGGTGLDPLSHLDWDCVGCMWLVGSLLWKQESDGVRSLKILPERAHKSGGGDDGAQRTNFGEEPGHRSSWRKVKVTGTQLSPDRAPCPDCTPGLEITLS